MLKVLVSKVVQTGFNNLSSSIYQRKYIKRKGKWLGWGEQNVEMMKSYKERKNTLERLLKRN